MCITFYGGGYGALGKSQERFVSLCHKLARDLPMLLTKHDAQAVVVRGSSGLSVAFGVRMLADIPFIVARKPAEKAHGGPNTYVGQGNIAVNNYIFLDDLIDTGSTVEGVDRDLFGACMAVIVTYDGTSFRLIEQGEFNGKHRYNYNDN